MPLVFVLAHLKSVRTNGSPRMGNDQYVCYLTSLTPLGDQIICGKFLTKRICLILNYDEKWTLKMFVTLVLVLLVETKIKKSKDFKLWFVLNLILNQRTVSEKFYVRLHNLHTVNFWLSVTDSWLKGAAKQNLLLIFSEKGTTSFYSSEISIRYWCVVLEISADEVTLRLQLKSETTANRNDVVSSHWWGMFFSVYGFDLDIDRNISFLCVILNPHLSHAFILRRYDAFQEEIGCKD